MASAGSSGSGGSGGLFEPVRATIWDEPASKSNQRINFRTGRKCPKCRLGTGAIRSIKSKKARKFLDSVNDQLEPLPELLQGELRMDIAIWYRTQRPDLDESIVLDALQGIFYKDDRQVRERHVYHFVDKEHPRVVVKISRRQKESCRALSPGS